MCVLPMYQELENRSPEKFDKIMTNGFSALFVIFAGFSVLAYLLYGPGVESNILQNLPVDIGSDVAQVGMMVVVACVYPIMLYPMVAIQPIASRGVAAQQIAKVVIVLLALLTSIFVTTLGFVNVINGAMSAAVFVALIPSLFGLLLLDTGALHKVALVLLLVGGLCVSGMGFVFSDNYVADLKCLWGA